MNINSKYDIGQEVLYRLSGQTQIGIIRSISVQSPMDKISGVDYDPPQSIFYFLKHGYGGAIPKSDIIQVFSNCDSLTLYRKNDPIRYLHSQDQRVGFINHIIIDGDEVRFIAKNGTLQSEVSLENVLGLLS